MAINWSNALSVGVRHIDNQHKEMIVRVNRLLNAMQGRKGLEELERAIKFLEAYVVVHFKAEEELMSEHEYPEMKSHVTEHEHLRKEVAHLRKKFNDGIELSFLFHDARKLCLSWFSHHLERVDRSFGSFLKSRGVKGN